MNPPASKRSRTPFGSTSRLVACPVCAKRVHILLAVSHVESHFSDAPDEEAPPLDGGAPCGGAAAAAEPAAPALDSAKADAPLGVAREAAGGSICAHSDAIAAGDGGGGDGDDEDEDSDDVPFGGAPAAPLADDGHASTYVPGTDAVWVAFKLQVMSGDHLACGLCLEPFEPGVRDRFVLWPCQHARQCGPCALKVWTQPKARRRCPWCKGKLDIRPRAFRPFM